MNYTIAVVGAGIGAAHLAGLAILPDRFRVKTVCDLDDVRGRSLADRNLDAFVLHGRMSKKNVRI